MNLSISQVTIALDSALKNKETVEIQFPIDSNITIDLEKDWAIYYIIDGTLSSSWMIHSSISMDTWSWTLYLENLWWHTTFSLNSNNDFISKYTNYTITKTIWNKQVIKTIWEIQNY